MIEILRSVHWDALKMAGAGSLRISMWHWERTIHQWHAHNIAKKKGFPILEWSTGMNVGVGKLCPGELQSLTIAAATENAEEIPMSSVEVAGPSMFLSSAKKNNH